MTRNSRSTRKQKLYQPAALAAWAGLFMSVTTVADEVTETIDPQNREIELIARDKDAPARTVFIALEKVAHVARYELEILPETTKWTEPMSLKTVGGSVRIRLTPSKYRIRTRSVSSRGTPGGWSDWQPFNVPLKNIVERTPADGSFIQNTGNESQLLTLEWPRAASAVGYYVEVKGAKGKQLRRVKTQTNFVSIQLEGGRSYSWCVQPLLNMSDPPVTENCPFTSFTVHKTEEGLSKALTQVEPHPEATGYQFEVIRFENATSQGDPVIVQSKSHELKAGLEPGEYELRARTLFPQAYQSSWSPPKKFFVPHKPPVPLAPGPKLEIEAGDDEQAKITIAWEPRPRAVDYTLYVFKENGELIHLVNTKETQAELALPEGERYYWQVTAYSANEPHRSPASVKMDPQAASEFYVKPYFPFLFSASESPAPYYGWVRYVASSADYYSESFDDNAIVRQSIQAGELNLAGGYWHRKSRLGVLAGGGLQSYRTTRESVFQKNASLSLGYRMLWDGDQRARIWLGYAYREIPSLVANPSTRNYQIKHLTTAGPQLTLSYMNSLTQSLGYQFHSRLFLGLQDLGSPNNMPQESALALSASAALSYKISPKAIGLFGYSYQLDNGSYTSADTPGKSNRTSLTGHYLTFGLEFALSDPKK